MPAVPAGGVRRHRGPLELGDLFARSAGSSMPVNLKSKSSPAAVSKSTRPTPRMRSRKLWYVVTFCRRSYDVE